MHKKKFRYRCQKKGWSKRLSRNKISDRNQIRIIGVQKKTNYRIATKHELLACRKKQIIGLLELLGFIKKQLNP